jgi:hypothetical protein
MLELPVTALSPHKTPTVLAQEPDDITGFHALVRPRGAKLRCRIAIPHDELR